MCLNLVIGFDTDGYIQQVIQCRGDLNMVLSHDGRHGGRPDNVLRNGIAFWPKRCNSLRNPIQLRVYQTICTYVGDTVLPLTGMKLIGNIVLNIYMGQAGNITQSFQIHCPLQQGL